MGDTEDSDVASKPGDEADGDFLERWSRRKTGSRKGETDIDSPLASTAAGLPIEDAATADTVAPRPELTDADMPPIESLDKDSDFSLFMSPKVSEQLRTQALRKLFHLPAFNITDGLNDYDEDYTQFAGLGSVVTHEMKRMLRRELEAEDAPEDLGIAATEIPAEPADTDLIEHADDDNA